MKKVVLFFMTFLCFLFLGCERACNDKYFTITIRNESMDTVYCSPLSLHVFPTKEYYFEVLPPGAAFAFESYQSDVDDDGLSNYVIRKKVADTFGIDRIIQERIYDTVYVSHSYDELKARGFVVKIRQADFTNSPYGADGNISPW